MDASKPLPCKGKMVVTFGGRTAETEFSLPGASMRSACAEELARVGWLTVGRIPKDGFALQVRCHALATCTAAQCMHCSEQIGGS